MKQIDEQKLESDLAYRFNYLTEFVGFGAAEIQTILGSAALLAPLVPTLVDAVYDKLHQYDCTWRHFVPKQSGYEGETPAKVEDLSMDHPQIKFRKQHLARYLERLVTGSYNEKMIEYLDAVGKMHTTKLGSSEIHVPLVQMNALMGFVADSVNTVLLATNLPDETKTKAIRVFSKLLWIQNDFISRHYTA